MNSQKNKFIKILVGLTLFLTLNSYGQTPDAFSYQSVIRNASNNLVVNQNIGMRISILQGSATGPIYYQETHNASTNTNGLVSIAIGRGTNTNVGILPFSGMNWASIYFIQVETDLTGGTNYTLTSTAELLSVPNAMWSTNSERTNAVYGTTGRIPYFSNNYSISNTSLYWDGFSKLGVNLAFNENPLANLDVDGTFLTRGRFVLSKNNFNPLTNRIWAMDVDASNSFRLFTQQDLITPGVTYFKINSNGNIGINKEPDANYRLDVQGTTHSNSVVADNIQVGGGTLINGLLSGVAPVGSSGSSFKDIQINFPNGYVMANTNYRVLATLEGDVTGLLDRFSLTVVATTDCCEAKTTTGFWVRVFRNDGSSWGNTTLKVNWLAIQ